MKNYIRVRSFSVLVGRICIRNNSTEANADCERLNRTDWTSKTLIKKNIVRYALNLFGRRCTISNIFWNHIFNLLFVFSKTTSTYVEPEIRWVQYGSDNILYNPQYAADQNKVLSTAFEISQNTNIERLCHINIIECLTPRF